MAHTTSAFFSPRCDSLGRVRQPDRTEDDSAARRSLGWKRYCAHRRKQLSEVLQLLLLRRADASPDYRRIRAVYRERHARTSSGAASKLFGPRGHFHWAGNGKSRVVRRPVRLRSDCWTVHRVLQCRGAPVLTVPALKNWPPNSALHRTRPRNLLSPEC